MIGAYLLQAGGSIALKIMGYKDSTISKFGRWTSKTWQIYIHVQISKLSEGGVQKMSTYIPYHDRSCIEPPQR